MAKRIHDNDIQTIWNKDFPGKFILTLFIVFSYGLGLTLTLTLVVNQWVAATN